MDREKFNIKDAMFFQFWISVVINFGASGKNIDLHE